MSERRRGQETKDRILEEACKVFAEKGYRDSTHAEICKRAGTNVAAINYYFDSKETLYRAVVEYLAAKEDELYPLDGGLGTSEDAVLRLNAFIRGQLNRMFDPHRLGLFHRIRMAEMFDRTGLLDEPLKRRLEQDRARILSILRDLLGPQVPEHDVAWCEMSIIGQCFMSMPGPHEDGPRKIFGLTENEVERLAEHILQFSLAGVQAIRSKYEKQAAQDTAALTTEHGLEKQL